MSTTRTRNVEWEYLMWLSDISGFDTSSNAPGFWNLIKQLYNKGFIWVVPNDDNRVGDGMYLRELFQEEFGGLPIFGPTNMLEVMVVLARRLSFEMSEESDDVGYWFAILLNNAGLDQFPDDRYIVDPAAKNNVDHILERIIKREYDHDGSGGFFPITFPEEDQRGVELWYQLNSYILERGGC